MKVLNTGEDRDRAEGEGVCSCRWTRMAVVPGVQLQLLSSLAPLELPIQVP